MEEVDVQSKLMMVNLTTIKIFITSSFQMDLFGLPRDQLKMYGICGSNHTWKILFFNGSGLFHSIA